MTDRKLVTIRIIDSVEKHPNADVLDLVKIGGWQCVSKLGTFKAGDRCVYVEIDSFVPTSHPAFAFLEKDAIKWQDMVGARIKTIRLRKEISQGLLVPIGEFPELASLQWHGTPESSPVPVLDLEPEAIDLAPLLGIEKWEKPLSAQLAGVARGNFPSFLRKTDQERVQNYWNGFGVRGQVDVVTYRHPETGEDVTYEKPRKYIRDTLYEVSVKLDGSSMTAYWRDGEFGVCSRNLDLAETEGNTFWQVARRLQLRERLAEFGRNIALQGELIGPSIQGNNDRLLAANFYIFDIFDIDAGHPMDVVTRRAVMNQIGGVRDDVMLRHVPIVATRYFDFPTIEDALAFAEGPSLNVEAQREGVVFKSLEDPEFSFKIISNSYLLAHSDR